MGFAHYYEMCAELDRLRAENAALRERVAVLEAFVAKVADGHRYCEDGWYACPKHEEYFGHDDRCDCWCEPAREALAAAKPAAQEGKEDSDG